MARIRLSSQDAVQLTFGYRPAWWIARRADSVVPPDMVDILTMLFPQLPAGVARSDYF